MKLLMLLCYTSVTHRLNQHALMNLQNALRRKAANLSVGCPKNNKHISLVKELANLLMVCAAVLHIKSKTARACPARQAQCHYCNKNGHYSKVCHQKMYEKQANTVGADCQSITDNEDDFDDLEQSTVAASKGAHEIVADVTFYGNQQQKIPGKVDTVAMVTCMPQSLLKDIHINLKDIKPTKLKL